MKKKILLLLFLVHYSILVQAQAFEIKIKLSNWTDSVCYFGHYFGETQFLIDTQVVKNQSVTFKGKEDLKKGMYLIVFQDTSFSELIINQDQKFSITSDRYEFNEKIAFKGSKENERFYTYLNFLAEKRAKVTRLRDSLELAKTLNQDRHPYQSQIDAIDKEVAAYISEYKSNNSDDFFTKVIKAGEEVPISQEIRKDRFRAYYYYRAHFFDNIDFSDERMLRTNVFHSKVKKYVEELTVQRYDSIIPAVENLLDRVRDNKEMFKYMVTYITNRYQNPKRMGNDAVFVHMVDKYFNRETADWVDTVTLLRIQDRADNMRQNLLHKIGPDLKFADPSGNYRFLYQVKSKYTVLYFYSYGCSHCKKTTPKMKELLEKYRYQGLSVYAVCTNDEVAKWMKYIEEQGTQSFINVFNIDGDNTFRKKYDVFKVPRIYLMDENKKIIAKGLEPDQLDRFMKIELEKGN